MTKENFMEWTPEPHVSKGFKFVVVYFLLDEGKIWKRNPWKSF